MKKGANPQLTYKWWNDNKATSLRKSGLGKALKEYEKAKPKPSVQRCSRQELGDYIDSLIEVRNKAEKAVSLCVPKLHTETKLALKRMQTISNSERHPLEKLLDKAEKDNDAILTLGAKNKKIVKTSVAAVDKCLQYLRNIDKEVKATTDVKQALRLKQTADNHFAKSVQELQKGINASKEIHTNLLKCVGNVKDGESGKKFTLEYIHPIKIATESMRDQVLKTAKPLVASIKAEAAKKNA